MHLMTSGREIKVSQSSTLGGAAFEVNKVIKREFGLAAFVHQLRKRQFLVLKLKAAASHYAALHLDPEPARHLIMINEPNGKRDMPKSTNQIIKVMVWS